MSRTDIELAFDVTVVSEGYDIRPNWNVAPSQIVGIIVERDRLESDVLSGDDDGDVVRALEPARWDLIPPWFTEPTTAMINARVETLADKRSFAPSLAKRRCIIPASGYFEWKKDGGKKQPYYIYADSPLAFAGLYSWWKGPQGWALTATIITRAAEGDLAIIHDRMPVILNPEDYADWLDPHLVDPHAACALLLNSPTKLNYYPVSREVGKVHVNSPANIEPLVPNES